LELLTDLCFVVAVAQAATTLHHGLVSDQVGHYVVGYAMSFFAIWWAWINFTWFASAYDNDDVAYRLLTILQIIGVLVLAAGIPGLVGGQVMVPVLGYVIMRVALVVQWLRAARGDPAHRATCLRYAVGIVIVQLGWVSYIWVAHEEALRGPAYLILVLADVAVPVFAERAGMTTWHPQHIADRYGAFFIIVLGETILASTLAIEEAFSGDGHGRGSVILLMGSGVLIVFSVWWLYFSREATEKLALIRTQHANQAFVWGFGHYFIFGSAAAVGAGLSARVEYWTHEEEISALTTGFGITVPVAALLVALWAVHLRRHDPSTRTAVPFGLAVLLILASTFTAYPEVITGLVLVVLLVIEVRLAADSDRTEPAVAEARPPGPAGH
jgi:low temperature requirement protein LtrA